MDIVKVGKAFQRTNFALGQMCREMYRKDIELGRIAKVVSALLMAGMAPVAVPDSIVKRVLLQQRSDGGWAGVQDTAWCSKVLSFYKEEQIVDKALGWLKNQQVEGSGWGRSARDMGRIPVTGSLLYLFSELGLKENLQWLEKKWLQERGSLTYKAAYTLLAFKNCSYHPQKDDLIEETLVWLVNQQEQDGGFAPWHGHPVGSNVLCTSLSLLALLAYSSFLPNPNSIYLATANLLQTQLPSGLWPFHQLDDGATWGLLALRESYMFFEGQQEDYL